MLLAKYCEQRVAVEPPTVLIAECVVAFAGQRRRGVEKEPSSLAQQREFLSAYFIKVNRGCRVGQRLHNGTVNVAAFSQPLQADHEDVSGESGSAGVWRVAVADRTQWKNLPERLPSGGKPVYELIGSRAQIANAPL